MLIEATRAQKYIIEKFGTNPPPGDYAVPNETSRGPAFMKVKIDEELNMSDFTLWWDEEFILPWYEFNPDGTKRIF